MSKSELHRLSIAIKEAISSVKRENKTLGISKDERLIIKPDGIYIKAPNGKLRLLKNGDYKRKKVNKIHLS